MIYVGSAYDATTELEPLIRDSELPQTAKTDLLYLMGRAQEALGNGAEAQKWFSQVRELELGYRDVEERLRQLSLARRGE